MSIKKYRPYFTLAELKHIEKCLLELRDPEGNTRSIRRYIHKYINDIESGFRASNHTMKPSILDRLGFPQTDGSPAEICEDDFIALEKQLSERIIK